MHSSRVPNPFDTLKVEPSLVAAPAETDAKLKPGSATVVDPIPPLPKVHPLAVPPSIKMVAIDLDGTLLNDSKKVTDATIKSLAELMRRGIRVVIATARPPRSVRHVYELLGLDALQVNYNGALIWDESKREAVFHRPMPGILVAQIIAKARDLYADLLCSCEVMDRWYTDRHDPNYTTETGRLFTPDVVCHIDQIVEQPITKLMFLGHPELMTALEPVVSQGFLDRVSVLRADDDLIQIMDRQVSKAVAVQKIAEHYGVSMAEVMAIGDAPNDVAMLQTAGVAIAVDNAHERVKAVAHWIAPSNNDHGVHAALVRYGLVEP